MVEYTDPDLNEDERAALHNLQIGIEKFYRGYGAMLEWHHLVGGGMDYFAAAEEQLRDAGHTELADTLRDRHLPAGAIDDRWTYELVDQFQAEFLADVSTFERDVREVLADGSPHVVERRQQRAWRERAETDDWRSE